MVVVEAVLEGRQVIEADYSLWLPYHFEHYLRAPFAPHHEEFWRFVWSIEPDVLPVFRGQQRDAFIAIWPRGGAKTTSGELAVAALAARRKRRFGVVVSSTRDQANERVGNVAAMVTSREYARWYPDVARRQVRKYGVGRWSVAHLQTDSGFNLRAFGLDSPMRGAQIEGERPDLIVLDDIDREHDSPYMTRKKIEIITRAILPMRAPGAVVLGLQNLIIRGGVFDQLRGGADWLVNRYVSGPHPAIVGLRWEEYQEQGRARYRITGGTPTWAGFSIDRAQEELDAIGIAAFLVEMQHDLRSVGDLVFEHFDPEVHAWRATTLPHIDIYVGGIDYGGEGTLAHKSALMLAGYNVAADLLIFLRQWEDNGPGVQDRQRKQMWEWEREFGRIRWRGGGDQYRENAELRKMGFRVADNDRSAGAINRREREMGARLGNYRDAEGNYVQPHLRYLPRECALWADQMQRLRRRPPKSDDDPDRRETIAVYNDSVDASEYVVEEIMMSDPRRSTVLARSVRF